MAAVAHRRTAQLTWSPCTLSIATDGMRVILKALGKEPFPPARGPGSVDTVATEEQVRGQGACPCWPDHCLGSWLVGVPACMLLLLSVACSLVVQWCSSSKVPLACCPA